MTFHIVNKSIIFRPLYVGICRGCKYRGKNMRRGVGHEIKTKYGCNFDWVKFWYFHFWLTPLEVDFFLLRSRIFGISPPSR